MIDQLIGALKLLAILIPAFLIYCYWVGGDGFVIITVPKKSK